MAITELYTGTEAVTNTEWSTVNDSSTIADVSTDGVFQLFLDLSDMVAGDQLRIRVYERVRGADSQRVVYEAWAVGTQSLPIWVSPSLVLMNGWDFTLYGASGTMTVTWSIRQVA